MLRPQDEAVPRGMAGEQAIFWYYDEFTGNGKTYRVVGHDGSDPGGVTLMGLDLDSGVGAVLLTNMDENHSNYSDLEAIFTHLLEVGEALLASP